MNFDEFENDSIPMHRGERLVTQRLSISSFDLFLPVNVVDDAGLKEEISSRHQVVENEVLIGPHCDAVANTQ